MEHKKGVWLTTILPTSRAIRQHILMQREENAFLPRYLTMGEFLSRALVVDGYRRGDRDTRTLALLEAADFSAFSHLQIERNFFTFTRNASYLFRFFEELAGEQVDLQTLDMADTYGDFAEHIEILKLLHERYRGICDERKLLDPIFLAERYRLNEGWIRSLEGIVLEAEGYLTNFEFAILEEVAGMIPVQIDFEAHRFNTVMQEKLAARGFVVEQGRRYRFDLGRGEVLQSEKIVSDAQIESVPFSERLLQVAFVKQKVAEMIDAGIAPEAIAVVLPDESFAPYLRRFDAEGNFNFAMGEPLSESRFVALCEALMGFAENRSVENGMRVQRLSEGEVERFSAGYNSPLEPEAFNALIGELLEREPSTRVREIVGEQLFIFRRLLPLLGSAPLRAVMHLFINRLKEESLDDVRGGKVTVMGVLETRACAFDGVIIVDFNEAYVPHKSDKDLFINSAVRRRAGLPGTREREALQKLFYHQLIRRAKRVAISYVSSETVLPSRFLKELKIGTSRRYSDRAWAQLLFQLHPPRRRELPEIEAAYDFTAQPLSATGLKTFLECRRKFYHRYVEKLKEHRLPREMPEEYEIGNALHSALRTVYTAQDAYDDASQLRAAAAQALAQASGASELERYLQQLWIKRLDPFFEREVERFASVRVMACERKFGCDYRGLRLEGQIDRIDRGPEGLEVLDYKSGSFPLYTQKTVENATDFQLEFYHLLASQIGEVDYCGYYDLKSGAIVKEPVMALKMELLEGHLERLRETKTFRFEQTDDLKRCRFCPYAHLCGRELS